MSDDPPHWASSSPAFSIVLSSARGRIAELGCAPIGEDPKVFVDRGGLRRLETEAVTEAIKRVREAAYPLIFNLFGSDMPRGKKRKLVLTRLADDLAHIENALGYKPRRASGGMREQTSVRLRRSQEHKRTETKAEKK